MRLILKLISGLWTYNRDCGPHGPKLYLCSNEQETPDSNPVVTVLLPARETPEKEDKHMLCYEEGLRL